jgi:hypothetical protein
VGLERGGEPGAQRAAQLAPRADAARVRARPEQHRPRVSRRGPGRPHHRDQVAHARQARDQARAGHRWLAWLRGVLAVRRLQRQIPPAPARASVPSGREEAAAAGVQAEQSTAAALARELGDEWTLLRGCR